MHKKYLLTIDPGLATGLGFIDMSDTANPKQLWTKEVNIEEFYKLIPEVIDEYASDLEVVCENFIITVATAKKSQAPWSLNLIGVVQYLCWLNGVKLTLQKPAERMMFDSQKLKAIGFWHVGGAGHSNEALKHAGVYLVNIDKKLALKILNVIE